MTNDETELPWEVSTRETKQLFENGEVLLVDCREPRELQVASISGAHHIPMGETPQRVGEFGEKDSQRIIVFCHHGMRSLQVAQFLRQQGFKYAQSMTEGIDAWSREIDSSVPRY